MAGRLAEAARARRLRIVKNAVVVPLFKQNRAVRIADDDSRAVGAVELVIGIPLLFPGIGSKF